MKINPAQTEEIIKAYTSDLTPMIALAKKYGVSRMAIWKILNRYNIDTTKAGAANIQAVCNHCGKKVMKKRCQYRKTLHTFCTHRCFSLWLNRDTKNPLVTNRQAGRAARRIVSECFNLQPWHIVHHEDRNEINNALENLRVFESQSDHVRYHRGFNITPIWIGSADSKPLPVQEQEYIS